MPDRFESRFFRKFMKLPKPDVDRNAKIFRTYPILVLCRVCQNSRAEWATDHSGGLLPWRGSS